MIRGVYRSRDGLVWVKRIQTPKGPMRVLVCGGAYQSASLEGERRFDPPFAYLASFDHVFELPEQPRNMLMIGGGGFAWPKHIAVHHPECSLDVVELDSAFLRASKRHLYLEEALKVSKGRLRIFLGDGAAYLAGELLPVAEGAGVPHERYDAIINDAFCGLVADSFLLSSEGIALVKNRLANGGAYCINVVADLYGEQMEQALTALSAQFVHVYVIDAIDRELSGADNYLVVGSDVECNFTDVVMVRSQTR